MAKQSSVSKQTLDDDWQQDPYLDHYVVDLGGLPLRLGISLAAGFFVLLADFRRGISESVSSGRSGIEINSVSEFDTSGTLVERPYQLVSSSIGWGQRIASNENEINHLFGSCFLHAFGPY